MKKNGGNVPGKWSKKLAVGGLQVFIAFSFRRDRQGVPSSASSWGHRNVGGTCHTDTGDRVERAKSKIPKRVRAWCDARGRCHTEDNFSPRCTQTGQVCVSLATHDSAGRIRAQSPGTHLLPKPYFSESK